VSGEHRRADDTGALARPLARVVSVKQLAAIVGLLLAVVTLIQTLGLKFVADSYIDQRIRVHNIDARAHEGAIAAAVQDGDRVHLQLETLRRDLAEATKTMNDTNQRLARLEGVLSETRRR
jgi:hypothetical protein